MSHWGTFQRIVETAPIFLCYGASHSLNVAEACLVDIESWKQKTNLSPVIFCYSHGTDDTDIHFFFCWDRIIKYVPVLRSCVLPCCFCFFRSRNPELVTVRLCSTQRARFRCIFLLQLPISWRLRMPFHVINTSLSNSGVIQIIESKRS